MVTRLTPLLALLLFANAAVAQEIGPNDFQITDIGTPGDTGVDAFDPAVAFNTMANEYLVVFEADVTDGLTEVWGQRVAADGSNVGTAFMITDITTGNSSADAFDPVVAYNPTANEYFVAFYADPATDGLADNEFEIFGQRVGPDGALLGTMFRISSAGADGDADIDADSPSVAYNPVTNEYLVAFEADSNLNLKEEIFARLVDASGTPLGTGDIRVSNIVDGDPAFDVFEPDVAFTGAGSTVAPNGYVVVFRGDDNRGTQVDGETEIFAQYLSSTGVEVGPDDQRISDAGPDGDTSFFVAEPDVACTETGVCFVAWHGDGDADVDNAYEIYGQLLDAAGNETGNNDFRISEMMPDGDTGIDAFSPDVAYNPGDGLFLVTWNGDEVEGTQVAGEDEIFAEYYDVTGTLVSDSDIRISDLGPDGDTAFDATDPAAVYNSVSGEFLVVFEGDDTTDGETEIFGQRLVGNTAPDCLQEITATVDNTTVSPGDILTFSITVVNNDPNPATVDLWIEASGPENLGKLIASGTLLPSSTTSRNVQIRVPEGTLPGTYDTDLNIGVFDTSVCDAAEFSITVAPLARRTASGASTDLEIVEGEDFFAASATAASAAAAGAVTVAPNPFSAQTQIAFAVTAEADVRLAVYDVLGREVAVLVDAPVEVGAHTATFDATGLAAGTYVYRLTVGHEVQTGRITLAH